MNSSARLVGATLSIVVTSALATYVIIFASHVWSESNWVWLLGFPVFYTRVLPPHVAVGLAFGAGLAGNLLILHDDDYRTDAGPGRVSISSQMSGFHP